MPTTEAPHAIRIRQHLMRNEFKREMVFHISDRLHAPENVAKGTWRLDSKRRLAVRLVVEVGELLWAVARRKGREAIWREAADVAICAAMLADVAGRG